MTENLQTRALQATYLLPVCALAKLVPPYPNWASLVFLRDAEHIPGANSFPILSRDPEQETSINCPYPAIVFNTFGDLVRPEDGTIEECRISFPEK